MLRERRCQQAIVPRSTLHLQVSITETAHGTSCLYPTTRDAQCAQHLIECEEAEDALECVTVKHSMWTGRLSGGDDCSRSNSN